MAKGQQTHLEHNLTITTISEWVAAGKPRQEILKKIQEEFGFSTQQSVTLYYQTLKELAPDPNMLDDYKKSLVQQNLDRLEKIINTSIDGNYNDKNVALKAIDQINKLLGIYNDNNVVIAKNKEGDEIIKITFGT